MSNDISPFLRRDYKHVADYAPARGGAEERLRADKLKAKMLTERLLFKKWDRSGALRWRVIQRIGDHGREYAIWYLLALYAGFYALRGR